MSKNAKVSGSVVAGFPSPAEQYQETPLDLNELLVKRPVATFFVKVQGDSMIGEGIRDGDLLVVDRSLRPASGDVIIACVDGDFTVKTLRSAGSVSRVAWASRRLRPSPRSLTTSARSNRAASSCCRTIRLKFSPRFPLARCGALDAALR